MTKRFTLTHSGRYQLRLEYAGSDLIVPGVIKLGFRVTRRCI